MEQKQAESDAKWHKWEIKWEKYTNKNIGYRVKQKWPIRVTEWTNEHMKKMSNMNNFK